VATANKQKVAFEIKNGSLETGGFLRSHRKRDFNVDISWLKKKLIKLVNESLQLKIMDAGSIPAGSTTVFHIYNIM